jgi:hypothetical protein
MGSDTQGLTAIIIVGTDAASAARVKDYPNCPGWPQPEDPAASVTQVLGLKACTTTLGNNSLDCNLVWFLELDSLKFKF